MNVKVGASACQASSVSTQWDRIDVFAKTDTVAPIVMVGIDEIN